MHQLKDITFKILEKERLYVSFDITTAETENKALFPLTKLDINSQAFKDYVFIL